MTCKLLKGEMVCNGQNGERWHSTQKVECEKVEVWRAWDCTSHAWDNKSLCIPVVTVVEWGWPKVEWRCKLRWHDEDKLNLRKEHDTCLGWNAIHVRSPEVWKSEKKESYTFQTVTGVIWTLETLVSSHLFKIVLHRVGFFSFLQRQHSHGY